MERINQHWSWLTFQSVVGLAKFWSNYGNFAVIAVVTVSGKTEGYLRKVGTFNCNQNLNIVLNIDRLLYFGCGSTLFIISKKKYEFVIDSVAFSVTN